ncbi:MAG: methyltransferase domain-containing protein [Acidobacteria bacterium]|nr:methyltransferase domain-containing protein [Acidobacteriota bacterium]
MSRRDPYVPAAGFHAFSRWYDPIVRLTTRESAFKRRLLQQAGIENGHRVLDLGCGTATLTLLIKQMHPQAEVIGLDADPTILRLAQAKAARAGLALALDCSLASALPYPADSFDRVLSSLFFHHLAPEAKRQAVREIFRVLRPRGELHVADWGRPQNVFMRLPFFLVQLLDGFTPTADNLAGRLPEFFRDAGCADVRETSRFATLFGTLALYRATKPA